MFSRNSGCLKRIILGIGAIIVILVVLLIVFQLFTGGSCIRRIDRSLPSISEAPYEVAAPTRQWLAGYAERLENGDVVIDRWYERTGDKWVRQSGRITIDADIYGEIQIRERSE